LPFAEGESLRQRLAREQQLPLDAALQITREVGSALQYAHQRGVVHRDIKPENIMLSDGQAVVADFGIARALHAANADQLTLSGMVVGTPQYMSPEQSGGATVDGRSDQYSLACTLCEMLIGQPPCSALFGNLRPTRILGLAGQLATWERMAPIVSGPPPCPTGAEE
jgi:serine/threonine-protein kinase